MHWENSYSWLCERTLQVHCFAPVQMCRDYHQSPATIYARPFIAPASHLCATDQDYVALVESNCVLSALRGYVLAPELDSAFCQTARFRRSVGWQMWQMRSLLLYKKTVAKNKIARYSKWRLVHSSETI